VVENTDLVIADKTNATLAPFAVRVLTVSWFLEKRHLRRVLFAYAAYYNQTCRVDQLQKDAPMRERFSGPAILF